jgi:hypothetical protein
LEAVFIAPDAAHLFASVTRNQNALL